MSDPCSDRVPGSPGVKDLFGRALHLSPPEQRALIEQACGNDMCARSRVNELLQAYRELDGFLDSPTDCGAPALDQDGSPAALPDAAVLRVTEAMRDIPGMRESPGTVIGPYKLLEPIGEGGFGTVFMAEQREPVQRRVALKIIKPGMDTRQVIARFEAERQALAMMDHPNIAKVHDAGATEAGRPYFVMELVKGVPITAFCDDHQLAIRQRLELFVDVCHAVQHAHTKGIIHRDIKPTNVLVTTHDDKAVPKVIDFGIAKATDASGRLTDKTVFTEFRQLIGTPEFMSPEQATLSGLDIDTRSDVYSLGVLLYELLTGVTPFDRNQLRASSLDEMRRIIREVEPPRPSTRLEATGARHKGTVSDDSGAVSLRASVPSCLRASAVRGDLDWIVMKCLEKDRTRRYETANGLAVDIGRYLSAEPVLAAPPNAGYRLRKFVRRHRVGVLASALVAAALVLGLVGTSGGVLWALGERERANTQAAEARKQMKIADAARKEAEKRQRQMQEIVEFQASQLRDIDMQASGVRMREYLLAEAQSAMTNAKLDSGEIESRLAELERLLAGANLTNVALRQLESDVFERALKAVDTKFADQPLVRAQLLQTLADTLRDLGLLDRATAPQAEALAIRRRESSDEHPDTLFSIIHTGFLLTRLAGWPRPSRTCSRRLKPVAACWVTSTRTP